MRDVTGMGSMSSGLSRQLDASKLTEQELEGHSQLLINGHGGVFEGGGLNASVFGSSTLNDRDVSSAANQSMVQSQANGADGGDPGFSQYWQDGDGDYSSDEEENKEEQDSS